MVKNLVHSWQIVWFLQLQLEKHAKRWQQLLNVFHSSIHDIDMTCYVTKTVCMVFNPLCRRKVVANSFPLLKLGSSYIYFVDCFKYLGHIITDNARDDGDIKREVRNLFVRTNVLICSCGRAGGPVAHGMGPQSLRPWTINMCDLEWRWNVPLNAKNICFGRRVVRYIAKAL